MAGKGEEGAQLQSQSPANLGCVSVFRRVSIIYGKNKAVSSVVPLLDRESWGEWKKIVVFHLDLAVADIKLFNSNGVEVKCLEAIRDDDTLYAFGPGDVVHAHSFTENSSMSSWVTLNVGGKLFTTTRSTLLCQEEDSMLARMFLDEDGKRWSHSKDATGAILIDRSPEYFEPILNFLRHGQLILSPGLNPRGVLEEARFYGLTSIIQPLEELARKKEPPGDFSPLSRREFVTKLLATPTNSVLRCQGLNFSEADLSRLDLRYVNFKYANMSGVNLSGCNLSYCNFERADLSGATLDNAVMAGVKMPCTNLEGASILGADFVDPAGTRANMEGANMRNVTMDDSRMAGINLRVATIKNSKLRNCDLRSAVLAGADLENSDLSGCDLLEANLRGANLKGANLNLMLNALHMSCIAP